MFKLSGQYLIKKMSWTSDSQSDHDISYQILEIAAHEMHAEKSVEWAANNGDE